MANKNTTLEVSTRALDYIEKYGSIKLDYDSKLLDLVQVQTKSNLTVVICDGKMEIIQDENRRGKVLGEEISGQDCKLGRMVTETTFDFHKWFARQGVLNAWGSSVFRRSKNYQE